MVAEGNVGLAFGLNIAAGLATGVGALMVFFSKLAKPLFLAVGLGFAAGVMLYVSFVDIFVGKGLAELEEPWGGAGAMGWGTLLFFSGMAFTWVLHTAVNATTAYLLPPLKETQDPESGPAASSKKAEDEDTAERDEIVKVLLDTERPDLMRMGVLTAIAIALHNLPEGIITFVGFLSDPVSGVAIAIAIALHNIPEGVCVAMPIFYATGSKWKGFLWAIASGLTEVLGGLIAYGAVHGNNVSAETFGALFCAVAGIMVYLCIFELIPTALKFDSKNQVTKWGVVAGMAVMALSLVFLSI